MRKHPVVVWSMMIVAAALWFGVQPARSQDSRTPDAGDESAVESRGDESAPADTGMEDFSDESEAPQTGLTPSIPPSDSEFEPGEISVEDEPAAQTESPGSGAKSVVPSGGSDFEPGEVAVEPPSETGGVIRYTVRPGDTLWDITRSVWSDPFLWPKVWKNNNYIFNPDLIYPGNVLEFPGDLSEPVMKPETAEAAPPPPMEEAPPAMEEPAPFEEEAPPPQETVEAPPPLYPELPPAAEPDFASLASNGFILMGHEVGGTVVGGLDARELFGKHDLVYIRPAGKDTVFEGDRIILSRKVRKVYHPESKKYIGELIHVLGVAEIVEAQQPIKTAKILQSFDAITINDSAIPYHELESEISAAQAASSEAGAAAEGRGYILDVKNNGLTNAMPEVVYLDRGMRNGLEKGNRLDVIRDGNRLSGAENLPWRRIGRVEVLIALDGTSTAKIIESTEPILKGDRYEAAP